MSLRRLTLILSLFALLAPALHAQRRTTTNPVDLSQGLRDLLDGSYTSAIKSLGRDGGFLNNLRVKIPVPKSLRPVEKTLRAVGRGKVADDFIAAMNRAAEKAVPEALSIFADSVKQMTFNDARSIVSGPDDAATQFFRRTSEARLRERFRPIVERFTQETGVTAQYKRFVERAGPLARLGGQDAQDLDGYVTQKALDGLFLLMADEEKRIRQNPVARTTDLLKIIFGRRR
jgi:hypothetical protein